MSYLGRVARRATAARAARPIVASRGQRVAAGPLRSAPQHDSAARVVQRRRPCSAARSTAGDELARPSIAAPAGTLAPAQSERRRRAPSRARTDRDVAGERRPIGRGAARGRRLAGRRPPGRGDAARPTAPRRRRVHPRGAAPSAGVAECPTSRIARRGRPRDVSLATRRQRAERKRWRRAAAVRRVQAGAAPVAPRPSRRPGASAAAVADARGWRRMPAPRQPRRRVRSRRRRPQVCFGGERMPATTSRRRAGRAGRGAPSGHRRRGELAGRAPAPRSAHRAHRRSGGDAARSPPAPRSRPRGGRAGRARRGLENSARRRGTAGPSHLRAAGNGNPWRSPTSRALSRTLKKLIDTCLQLQNVAGRRSMVTCVPPDATFAREQPRSASYLFHVVESPEFKNLAARRSGRGRCRSSSRRWVSSSSTSSRSSRSGPARRGLHAAALRQSSSSSATSPAPSTTTRDHPEARRFP